MTKLIVCMYFYFVFGGEADTFVEAKVEDSATGLKEYVHLRTQ